MSVTQEQEWKRSYCYPVGLLTLVGIPHVVWICPECGANRRADGGHFDDCPHASARRNGGADEHPQA